MTSDQRPGLRSRTVKAANLATILRTLHRNGAASRSQLVSDTGLTRTAVGALATELQQNGLVFETTPEPGGGPGRPSPIVTPEPTTNAVLALDLMVESIGVMAVGLGGTVLHSVRQDRSGSDLEATMTEAASMIASARRALDPACRLFGLGVAIPGLIRDPDRAVVVAPNLGWTEIDVADALGRRLGFDVPIAVANEANLGALAETRRGAAIGHRDVLYLSAEVGVGGGIISDGRLLTGGHGYGGEIGHLPVRLDGQRCRCGARGCLETEIGEEALLARIDEATGGSELRTVSDLLDAAETGDSGATAVLAEHTRWLAFGLAGLMNVLNPTAVVLGGFLSDLFPLVASTLRTELDQHLFPTVPQVQADVTITASSLGIAAPAIGAAELAWDLALDRGLLRSLTD